MSRDQRSGHDRDVASEHDVRNNGALDAEEAILVPTSVFFQMTPRKADMIDAFIVWDNSISIKSSALSSESIDLKAL